MKRQIVGKNFKINEYDYICLCVSKDFALYKVLASKFNTVIGYEVHRLRFREQGFRTIRQKVIHINEANYLANENEFGRYAWFYPNIASLPKEVRELWE